MKYEIYAGHGSCGQSGQATIKDGQIVQLRAPFTVHEDAARLLAEGFSPREVEEMITTEIGGDFSMIIRRIICESGPEVFQYESTPG